MNRNHLQAAVESGTPFTILMADGREYPVPHRDYIAMGPAKSATVVVYDEEEHFYVLPLLTMTGIKQKSAA